MGKTVQWDDSRWPLVVLRFIGDLDEADFDESLAFLDGAMERCAGLAFVITSSIVRGILTAILWVTDLPAPYTIVGTMAEAEQWAAMQLAAQGVPLPRTARVA